MGGKNVKCVVADPLGQQVANLKDVLADGVGQQGENANDPAANQHEHQCENVPVRPPLQPAPNFPPRYHPQTNEQVVAAADTTSRAEEQLGSVDERLFKPESVLAGTVDR